MLVRIHVGETDVSVSGDTPLKAICRALRAIEPEVEDGLDLFLAGLVCEFWSNRSLDELSPCEDECGEFILAARKFVTAMHDQRSAIQSDVQ